MRCARGAICTSAARRASISRKVAVKAHKAGKHNPYAQYRNEVTVEEVLGSRMIADPLSLFMCCPTGDGAAAAVVTSGAKAAQPGAQADPDCGVGAAVRHLQAGLSRHGVQRIDRAHRQQGVRGRRDRSGGRRHRRNPRRVLDRRAHVLRSARILRTGRRRRAARKRRRPRFPARKCVNPSGGLLCRGHPVGATGIAQVCEAVWQLRGEAERPAGRRTPRSR